MESVMDEERAADLAFRMQTVERMGRGENVTKLSRELGVSRWTMYRWRIIYLQQGRAGLAMSPVGRRLSRRARAIQEQITPLAEAQARAAELERKVGQQAVQIDFLKRAFKRVRESRRNSVATGGTASTERSE